MYARDCRTTENHHHHHRRQHQHQHHHCHHSTATTATATAATVTATATAAATTITTTTTTTTTTATDCHFVSTTFRHFLQVAYNIYLGQTMSTNYKPPCSCAKPPPVPRCAPLPMCLVIPPPPVSLISTNPPPPHPPVRLVSRGAKMGQNNFHGPRGCNSEGNYPTCTSTLFVVAIPRNCPNRCLAPPIPLCREAWGGWSRQSASPNPLSP